MPTPKKIYDDRLSVIEANTDNLTKQLERLQKEIVELLTFDLFADMETLEGNLIFNTKNLSMIEQIGMIFTQFEQLKEFEKKFAGQLYDVTLYSGEYFGELMSEFKEASKQVAKITKGLEPLYRSIGIDAKGNILEDGFLSKLFSSQDQFLQYEIQNYIQDSLANQKPYTEFVRGFKEMIEGTETNDGKLQKYYRQYAYDLYSRVARITDNYYADQLGLTYFVYDGTEIKTSRPFCKGGFDSKAGITFENKIGKVFNKSDTDKWKDIEWSGKYPHGDEYNPLQDVGGANCMHSARWVSDEYAMEHGYEPETDI